MAEQINVPSAVFIPEDIVLPPSRKRSLSPLLQKEQKRPRVGSAQNVKPREANKPASKGRSRLSTDANGEKGRGRRLFGAVLGALTQRSTSTERRRAEIERKQRDKLKAQAETDFSSGRDRATGAKIFRKRQSNTLDIEVSKSHQSENYQFNIAHFLRTSSSPPIFYLPLELKSHEKETVAKQIEKAKPAMVEQNNESVFHVYERYSTQASSASCKAVTTPQIESPMLRNSTPQRRDEHGIERAPINDHFRDTVDDNEELHAGVGEDSVIY